MKREFFFGVAVYLLLEVNVAHAQSYTGLRNDAFTPVTAIALNPAAIYGGMVGWSINLAAAGGSFNDNYLYYDHQSALTLNNYEHQHDALPQPSFHFVSHVRGFADGFAQGPSAVFKLKNFSIGFIDDDRWMASALVARSTSEMLPFYQLGPNKENRIPVFNVNYMNFGEVGINLGKPLAAKNLFGAITIKYLMGYDAATVQNLQPFQYQYNSTNANVSNFDGVIAYSGPVGKGIYLYEPRQWLGHGTAIDLGILKLQSRNDDNDVIPYKWKFGASVTDVGMLRYSLTSYTYQITSADSFLVPLQQFQKTVDLKELVKLGAQRIYDKNKAAVSSYSFVEVLPAMANVQFDYALTDKWWMNVSAMQRIHIFKNQMVRPNVLLIAPRYQTRFFTVNFPVSVYDYYQMHIGASVRVGFLTVGSDNISALFVRSKFSGADAYASLVIFPWMIEKELHGISHFHNKKKFNCPKL